MPGRQPGGMSAVSVVLVHAPACHFCADAEVALAELSREYPVEVELVAAESAAGQALVDAYRPAMFPLVLLDGAFFSAGRLPRRKLRAKLVAGSSVAATSAVVAGSAGSSVVAGSAGSAVAASAVAAVESSGAESSGAGES